VVAVAVRVIHRLVLAEAVVVAMVELQQAPQTVHQAQRT